MGEKISRTPDNIPKNVNCKWEGKRGRPNHCPVWPKVVEIKKDPEKIARSALPDVCELCRTDPKISVTLDEIDKSGHLFNT